jgi:phosphate transport system substrate-binding protein
MSVPARPKTLGFHKALLVSSMLAAGFLVAATTTASATNHVAMKTTTTKAKPKPKPKPKPTTTTVPVPTTNENPPSGSETISEEGSSLMYPLFELWAPAYNQEHSNITVTPAAGGSGKGVTDAANGVVDIGASDAYLSSSQTTQYPGLMNIPLAISSQMVNYNIQGVPSSTHLKLSGKVLSEIYQGSITSWNDPQIVALNPGVTLPAEPIMVLHRSDSSGDTFIFTQYLSFADPSGWGSSISYGTSVSFPAIPNSLGESGNGGMVTGCNATPGCIAYIGISYLSQTQKNGLGEAMLENASGNYELPVASTISSEARALESSTPADEALSLVYDSASDGYPIVNYEYAIVQQKQSSTSLAQAERAFLYWALDPIHGSATNFLSQVNFIPLTQGVVTLSEKQIAKIS